METVNIAPTGWTEAETVQFVFYNYVQVSVPSGRHELALAPRTSVRGSLSFLRATGNGLDPKADTFPRNGTQLCAVLATKQFSKFTADTRLLLAWINDLHPINLKLDAYELN